MTSFQSLRGTRDLVGDEERLWARIEAAARSVFERFGFTPIRTPILEEKSLFVRSVGEATDIVEKEMYVMRDRSDNEIALRPEGTAGVVRAFIEHHLGKDKPVNKFYYAGPMFRAERPQKGRLRQFHQLGVECLGSSSVFADCEVIESLIRFLSELGVTGSVLQINNLGEPADRAKYADRLASYLYEKESQLCEDCRRRLAKNVLRVLDCKAGSCQTVLAEAPMIWEHVSESSKLEFEKFRHILTKLGIEHRLNPRIVRGLDYYTHRVFELSHPALGSQDALAAGGRYDGLVASLGGAATPAVGFAIGVERLAMVLEAGPAPAAFGTWRGVSLIAAGKGTMDAAYELLFNLRKAGVPATLDLDGRSVKSQMRQADKQGSRYCVIVGEDELKAGKVCLKPMQEENVEEMIAWNEAVSVISRKLGN